HPAPVPLASRAAVPTSSRSPGCRRDGTHPHPPVSRRSPMKTGTGEWDWSAGRPFVALVWSGRRPRTGDRRAEGVAGAQPWDAEYDVVVAGSGAGALTGALTAAASGLRTIVLEKTALLGGTSAYSGASLWLPASQVQRRAGVADSTEAARAYLTALLGEAEAQRREAFLATAAEVVEFLERDPAIEFRWRAFPDYFPAAGRLDAGRSIVPLDLPVERLGDLAVLVRPPVEHDRGGT